MPKFIAPKRGYLLFAEAQPVKPTFIQFRKHLEHYMSDQMKLPEPGTEGSWEYPYVHKGQTIDLTVTEELIEQEILDQTDVKKPARKAILRATEKRISKVLKVQSDKMSQSQRDDLRWDLFILAVNGLMADRHLSVRNDPAIAKNIAKEFPRP